MTVPFLEGRITLPGEVVEDIAFALLAATPLDSMAPIIPLLQISKAFLSTLSPISTAALYARLCRLKFDLGAVHRRAFSPNNKDLSEYLIRSCISLRCIRRGDVFHEDVAPALLDALVMMLHDDGKNRAQLERAGIVEFVDRFLRLRLQEGKETNGMWPLENIQNSTALWLSWLFTTKEQLENETVHQRDEFKKLVLPFLLCPYRYASAYAPSNHFLLPLEQNPPKKPTAHGLYPVYHTQTPVGAVAQIFHSKTRIVLPPAPSAAKLLYWCRQELRPFFNIPVGLARNRAELCGNPGLTMEDLVEFNRFKVAKLRTVVRWDWNEGLPITWLDDGTRQVCLNEPSKQLDIDWWRIRICQSILWKQPRWRLGNIYRRGLLTGLWQGTYFLSDTEALNDIRPESQCAEAFSASFQLLPRPILMRLREHSFVHIPPLSQATTSIRSSSRMSRSRPPHLAEHPLVPTPIPSEDVSINNAWIPGAVGSLKWSEGDRLDDSIKRDPYSSERHRDERESMRFTYLTVPPGYPPTSQDDNLKDTYAPVCRTESDGRSGEHDSGDMFAYETFEAGKESVHKRMMRNAMGGELACDSSFSGLGREGNVALHPGCLKCAHRESFLKERRRDELDGSLRRSGIRESLTGDQIEEIFHGIGMGRGGQEDGDENGVFDLQLGGSGADNDADARTQQTPESVPCSGYDRGVQMNEVPPLCSSNGSTSVIGNAPNDCPGRARTFKRPYDQHQVERCEDGIEDTIVTGDMDDAHRLAWGNHVYYGRVRPWDGLIAILKPHNSDDPRGYGSLLFYGYIYGGDTFVGNWRLAGEDPTSPVFENPFIMSKRNED